MKKLKKLKHMPLEWQAIKPQGWLRAQLELQAKGLCGNLHKFWPDIKDSGWFGGAAEGWERVPYWLDGALPMAWLLDDKKLKAELTDYMNYIIEHQAEDGWLGAREANTPNSERKAAYDLWGQFLALKVMVLYYELCGDERIPDVVRRNLLYVDESMRKATLFDWAATRWYEVLIAVYWLYELKEEQWLLDLAKKIAGQGFDWVGFFRDWPLTRPTERKKWHFLAHVVNNAMAVKAGPLWWRMSDREEDKEAAEMMIEKLDEFHGSVTGVFTGDECLAGKSEIQGTELCAVVEYMYSLEHLLLILGDACFADRLERIAYNALPASISPDMWYHQYVQQVNQVECSFNAERCWNTNGGAANLFGVEPNFGCCTANFGQGWPKLCKSLWLKSDDEGLVATVWAPVKLETDIKGVNVKVNVVTDYPFRENVEIILETETAIEFPLYLRIPEWAEKTVLTIDGEKEEVAQTGYFAIMRQWNGVSKISLEFKAQVKVIEGSSKGAVAIERGALLYSLPIEEKWQALPVNEKRPWEEQYPDWEVFAMSPWNYALALSPCDGKDSFTVESGKVGKLPFSPAGAPIKIKTKGYFLPNWGMENSAAQRVPQEVEKTGGEEEITLIPYGCTTLRVTEFPHVFRQKEV